MGKDNFWYLAYFFINVKLIWLMIKCNSYFFIVVIYKKEK